MAHHAMPDHQRSGRPLLLGECEEMGREIATDIAVEPYKLRDPEAVEDREQQQWIVGRLSERISLFDQQTCPLLSRLGFRSSKPFDMDERGYECDLKFDLLTAQRGSGREGR